MCNYQKEKLKILHYFLFSDLFDKVTSPFILIHVHGKKFLLRHFFGQVLNRNNPSFIRASLLSKEFFKTRDSVFWNLKLHLI
jgi:hypothetical protein